MKFKQEIRIAIKLVSPDYSYFNIDLIVSLFLILLSYSFTLLFKLLKVVDNLIVELNEKLYYWENLLERRLTPIYGIG